MYRGNHGGWKQYRGGRGRSNGRGRGQSDAGAGNESASTSEDQSREVRGGGISRSRPPTHLRGREIGLWHAAHSRKKMEKIKEIEEQNMHTIQLTLEFELRIESLLKKLDASASSASRDSVTAKPFSYTYDHYGTRDEQSEDYTVSNGVGQRIPSLDETLKEELNSLTFSNSKCNNMQAFRKLLPAFAAKENILELVTKNQVVVISGETGCGKTTQVGQFVLDDMIQKGNGSMCNILCTQPRRISAISVAERVADERNERVGTRSVGYVIRLESRKPNRSRGTITFCTNGIVFQYLKSDPQLKNYSHIIVDEVHERDTNSDLLIAILKDLLILRPDLKVILMSATINADHFSKYFNNCPMCHIPGMTFAVKEYYLEDIIQRSQYRFSNDDSYYNYRSRARWESREYENFIQNHYATRLRAQRLYSESTIREILKPESEQPDCMLDLTINVLEYICDTDKGNGAVLIFLTGWAEISKLNSQIESCGKFPRSKFLIIPLHSMMPTVNQKDVFNRAPDGVRKIIIATNIAETSITIDDIVYVIDSGKIKITNYDLARSLGTLDSEWVSRANAKQRKGRAGRVQEGVCFHLFTKARESKLEDFKKPEILRVPLDEVILQLKILKIGDVRTFFRKLLDPPNRDAVNLAVERLSRLQALDDDENLTSLGFHLAHLPMDPKTGKMILMGAMFSCVDPVFSIAASLSFKDAFYIPLGKESMVDNLRKDLSDGTKSDHWVTIKVMEGYEQALSRHTERDYCYRNFLSLSTCNMLINFKKQFCEHLHRMKFVPSDDFKDPRSNINSKNIALIKSIVTSGLYPNVAKVRPRLDPSTGPPFPTLSTPEDGIVYIHPKSVNAKERDFESPYLVYHLKQRSKKINLYDTTMVPPYPLVFFGGKLDFSVKKHAPILNVDGIFEFKIRKETFLIIQALRSNLDKILENKIQSPSPTDWSDSSNEGALLRAIRELITSEYHQLMNPEPGSDEDSDY